MKPLPLHYWNFPRCCGKRPTVLSDKCSEFLREVVAELAKYPELGPGVIGRLQRERLNTPRRGNHVGSKYEH